MRRAVYPSALIAAIVFASALFAPDVGGLAMLMVNGIADYDAEFVFYVYYPGATKDSAKLVDCWWRRVEIDGAGKAVHVKPPTLGYGTGDLALLAVPRKLADHDPVGDAAWFQDGAPGILRVKGDLKVAMLYSSHGSMELNYRLDRRDGEFALALLNPERLQRENETANTPGAPKSDSNSTEITVLIGAGVALLIIAIVWGIRRSGSRPS